MNEFVYDAESNVLKARSRKKNLQFQYGPFGKLQARIEAGTTLQFAHDTEEQLVAIQNEYGSVYRFEYNPTGGLLLETGFDGVTKRYERDAANRIVLASYPSGRSATYSYDAADRIVGVEYSDGLRERFAYRADDELIQATNDATSVSFELDLVGNVLVETQDTDWVRSTYDALDQRVRVQSSRGFDLDLTLDPVGNTKSLKIGGSEIAFERDPRGAELERKLPGGARVRWERDRLGRPLTQEIFSGQGFHSARRYDWDVDDQLLRIIDALRGAFRYTHDSLGRLSATFYPEGHVDFRVPDAIGRLYRSQNRDDRSYGPAGQLLESRSSDGITRYEYDLDGNLVRKVRPDGTAWSYEWNAAGMLVAVVRPDGERVEFAYDALSRRVWKKFRAKVTRFIWDGNTTLHQWVEDDLSAPAAVPATQSAAAVATGRAIGLGPRTAQGPPPPEPLLGTAASPVGWVLEPDSLTPICKVIGERVFGIAVDHLGTPVAMFDDAGAPVWSAQLDAYGKVDRLEGASEDCPFRWPGQYEDNETGLHYNRLRYYDPDSGEYISQDPLRAEAALDLYAHVPDPNVQTDLFGLDPIHHIATNKNSISHARGGPWTPRFQKIFDAAGVDMDDPMNKVEIPGHKGPHPEEYHQTILERLEKATERKRTQASKKKALEKELKKLKAELRNPRTRLNKLVTKRAC